MFPFVHWYKRCPLSGLECRYRLIQEALVMLERLPANQTTAAACVTERPLDGVVQTLHDYPHTYRKENTRDDGGLEVRDLGEQRGCGMYKSKKRRQREEPRRIRACTASRYSRHANMWTTQQHKLTYNISSWRAMEVGSHGVNNLVSICSICAYERPLPRVSCRATSTCFFSFKLHMHLTISLIADQRLRESSARQQQAKDTGHSYGKPQERKSRCGKEGRKRKRNVQATTANHPG